MHAIRTLFFSIYICVFCSSFAYIQSLFYNFSPRMNIHWIPPPPGVIKVNVHGTSFQAPAANGNTSGLGIILRKSNGSMTSCIAGTIPNLSHPVVQLWAIYAGMRRAYMEASSKVVVETDNMEAYGILKFQQNGVPQEAAYVVQQIMILKNDPSWQCSIRYVYPRRNRAATYLALLGGELFPRMYLIFEPIGRVAELMDLDVGLGPHDPMFLEAPMHEAEMEQLDQAIEQGWGEPNGIGLAAEFRTNMGFHANAAPAAGEPGYEIHDLVYEDEILEDEMAVVIQE